MLLSPLTIRNVIRFLLVGDYDKNVIAHDAIPKALALAAQKLSLEIAREWLATDSIRNPESVSSRKPQAIWCVPGSPYKNMDGALTAIRFARENKIPFLGTCGGFQHALIEYARNVLKISDADHTESSPDARTPLISQLACSLVNKSETTRIAKSARLAEIYGKTEIAEPYQCRYGLNPNFRFAFEATPFHFTAFSEDGQVRAFELADHPFFFGTLFQPERSALQGLAHPLISAFLQATQKQKR
jgi:CTP synthase (UTP-ammonia lyase)